MAACENLYFSRDLMLECFGLAAVRINDRFMPRRSGVVKYPATAISVLRALAAKDWDFRSGLIVLKNSKISNRKKPGKNTSTAKV